MKAANKNIAVFSFILAGLVAFSCRKKVEVKEVVVEKKNSWTEIKRFTGLEKVFLSSGSSGSAIYLQQPFNLTEIKSLPAHSGITTYAAGLPSDVEIRVPIAKSFFVNPVSDSLLIIRSNENPTTSPSGGAYNLKLLDPTLTRMQTRFNSLFKCMAINKNGVLLLHYQNNRENQPLTFLLFAIKTSINYPYVDTLYTKAVTIPRKSPDAYTRHMAAVEDYFLLDLSANGVYKIEQNGNFAKVSSPKTIDAFYSWQGKVYAHVEWDEVLVSTDNGNNWQAYQGIPNFITLANYYPIKDSLVGVHKDNLFTLKWNGTSYQARFLKNDGVEGTRINGVEVLKDSVYLATTSGLFVKPVTAFFETK